MVDWQGMRTFSANKLRGFTLIELMVVIAIIATLAAISAPTLTAYLDAGNESKCRAQLEQLAQLGSKYGQDISHRALLPTSGMEDDEDTDTVKETDGWWLALAPELDTVVYPKTPDGKMKVSAIFHCPSDHRTEIGSDSTFAADEKSVSYVSWTDGSEDRSNPNSCIRLTAKQRLDSLPWLSDGLPVKGESVTDLNTFKKQVLPAAERHKGKVLVLYASGVVKAVEIDADDPKGSFKKCAPDLAKRGTAKKPAKNGKKPAAEEEDDDEPEEDEE